MRNWKTTAVAALIAIGTVGVATESFASCSVRVTIENNSDEYVRLGFFALQWKGRGSFNRQADPWDKVDYNSGFLERTKQRFRKNPSLDPGQSITFTDTKFARKKKAHYKARLKYKATSNSDLSNLSSTKSITSSRIDCGQLDRKITIN